MTDEAKKAGKIHWLSNSPAAPTGYGNQTQVFTQRINADYDVTMTAFYGLQGAPMMFSGMPVMPGGTDLYGNDTIEADALHFGADFVISLMDVWVLRQEVTQRFAWCPWLPVDHDPVPAPVLDALKTAYQPIAMSRFGQKALKEAGIDALYIPHGIDTSVFYPRDRAESRKELGYTDNAFIVGMVMANIGEPSRKAWDQQLRAFAEFQKTHPDAMVYLHTDVLGTKGVDIRALVKRIGIPSSAIIEVGLYEYARGLIGWDWMARMYSSLDVLMNATMGEGFGIPIIEAQACGCPVIVTDFSAMPELVRAGWKVGYSDKFLTAQGSYQVLPSVPELVKALEQAYEKRGDMDFREQARAGVAKEYDADVVYREQWKPALAGILARLKGQSEAVTAKRKAYERKRKEMRAAAQKAKTA